MPCKYLLRVSEHKTLRPGLFWIYHASCCLLVFIKIDGKTRWKASGSQSPRRFCRLWSTPGRQALFREIKLFTMLAVPRLASCPSWGSLPLNAVILLKWWRLNWRLTWLSNTAKGVSHGLIFAGDSLLWLQPVFQSFHGWSHLDVIGRSAAQGVTSGQEESWGLKMPEAVPWDIIRMEYSELAPYIRTFKLWTFKDWNMPLHASCCTVILYFSRYCAVRFKMFYFLFLCFICMKNTINLL